MAILKRVVCMLMLASLLFCVSPATTAQLTGSEMAELADDYAPIMFFHPDEQYYPISPDYALVKSDLRSMDLGLISSSPNAEQLSTYTDPNARVYLDNREGTINDDGIRDDFVTGDYEPVVHARVTEQNMDGRQVICVQYFFYYPFNNGPMNTHEGDWEMILIVLGLDREPILAAYSQHMGGAAADWALVLKEDTGMAPKVFVARGSHANYFRPYEGAMGPAQDECSDSGRVLFPGDYELVMMDQQPWLDFAGNWGDYGRESSGMMGERGPVGPAYQGDRWTDPISWSEGLKETTEVSLQLNWYMHNLFWLILGFMGLVFLLTAFVILRRKRKQGSLGPRLLPFLYIGGEGIRSAASILAILAIVIGVAGYFLPWYSVTMDIDAGEYSTPGPVEVLRTNGLDGMSFNRPEPGAGLVQVVSIPLPAGFLMLAGLLLFIFSSVGIMKTRKYGWKLLRRAFSVLMPALILIAQVSLIGYVVEGYVHDAPPEVMEIVDTVSANPLGGSTTGTIGEYGQVTLEWGIGPGVVLLLVSALLLFISAILLIHDNKAFFQPGQKGQRAVYQAPAYYQQQYSQPYAQTTYAQPVPVYCQTCGAQYSLYPGAQPFQCTGCGNWVYPPPLQ